MLMGLSVAAGASGVLAIMADWSETKPAVFYLLKPLTTILIAVIAWQAPASAYRELILIGLLLSLAGDVCLMFEGNLAFIGGLSSFLAAHVVFMWAFVHGLDPSAMPWWAAGFVVYGVVLSLLLLPRAGLLKLPVLLYGAALVGLAVTASIRFVALENTGALLALTGAALFVISDSALGARKFVGPYPAAQGLILATYWSAIGLIAASAVLL